MKILLATDSQKASDGAVRLAMTLQQQLGATVEAHRVVEPPPMVGEGVFVNAFPIDREAEGRGASAAHAMDEYLRSFGSPAADWPKKVEMGSVPHTIVHMAEEGGFTHIALGTGRHKLVDRWLGTETALRVMQLSHLPVLAVPPSGGTRPKRIVAAVDFSDFSRRAVELALEICEPGSHFDLVHVSWISPGDNRSFEYADWHERLRGELLQELNEWVESVPGLADYPTKAHVPAGKPDEEIIALADSVEADLIVAGTHGRGFLGRTVFGSVAKGLVRKAHTQLLVAPPEELSEDVQRMKTTENATAHR